MPEARIGLSPNQTIDRRVILKGAAWTVPAITMAVAAPTAAASEIIPTDPPPVALGGWLNLRRTGDIDENYNEIIPTHLWIEGGGAPPERGLWVTNTVGTETIGNAYITLYYSRPIDIGWIEQPGSLGLWTVPAYVGTRSVEGVPYYGYRTLYTGAFDVQPGISYAANTDFVFRTASSIGPASISTYALRTVTVNDEVIEFARGPIHWSHVQP